MPSPNKGLDTDELDALVEQGLARQADTDTYDVHDLIREFLLRSLDEHHSQILPRQSAAIWYAKQTPKPGHRCHRAHLTTLISVPVATKQHPTSSPLKAEPSFHKVTYGIASAHGGRRWRLIFKPEAYVTVCHNFSGEVLGPLGSLFGSRRSMFSEALSPSRLLPDATLS